MARSATRSAANAVYRRVIVKVSGEALSGPEGFGIHQPTIDRIATDLIAARKAGLRTVALLSGGAFSRAELEAAGAVAVYPDCAALLAASFPDAL